MIMSLQVLVYSIFGKLRLMFRRAQQDEDTRDELRDHLEHQIAEYLAQGMAPEEARRVALAKLGGAAQIEEQCREQRRISIIEDFWQDVRYGVRQLLRNPAFSIISLLCLTVGIGANAAVFSWMEGIGLRPFPGVAHQERLVAMLGITNPGEQKGPKAGLAGVSWPDFLDLRDNSKLMDALIEDKIMGTTLSLGDRAEVVSGSVVSANYFDALGVRPVLGRGFKPEEEQGRNAHPVTVISHWMWQQRFKGDPQIIGKTQRLNGVMHTIIGVAPEGFYGTFVGYPVGFWVPASMQETFVPGGYQLEDRGARWIEGFARLKPGVTIEQAQAEMSALAARLEADHDKTNRGYGLKLFPLWRTPFNETSVLFPTLEIALGVVFFVLLIACANVSGLLLVRSLARRHEITVRLALGARRRRLVKQLLTEGLILAALAAGGGMVVAYWCRNAIVAFFPATGGVNIRLQGQIDWRVLAVSAVVGLASTLLFALVPAIQASKVGLADTLKAESGSVFGDRSKSRLRTSLVALQVALSFVLLVGVFLLTESMRRTQAADPGFAADRVLVTGLDLLSAGYDVPRARTFQEELLQRVRALGGVEAAALARVRPFSYIPYSSATITVEGYEPARNEQPTAEYNQVGPGYFASIGIPLVAGREFTTADNESGEPVAIVNEKMVAQYWHGADPVGKRLQVKDRRLRVVGVAKTVKYEKFDEEPKPFFYVPLSQNFSLRAILMVKTERPAAQLAADVAREIRALDPGLGAMEVITLREQVNRLALSQQQVAAALLGIFGGLALLLAVVGLYGVISFGVTQSRHELALRMALGASSLNILRRVMAKALAPAVVGVVIGLAGAVVLTRVMRSLLYNVDTGSPMAFAAALLVMTAAALAACVLPAVRASKTSPARALRD
jgi:putative ABC transport system permease protein